jgi:hypothetical protein
MVAARLALAACTRLLMPPIRPLAILLSSERGMPSQWRLTVGATSITGSSRLGMAQECHFLGNPAAASAEGWS